MGKVFVVGSFMLLWCVQISAKECGEPGWIKDVNTGCQAWNPCPQPNETIEWTGECEGGRISGEGKLSWYHNGELVQIDFATFFDGRVNGRRQAQFYEDGKCKIVFVGNWKDGKENGVFEIGVITDDNDTYKVVQYREYKDGTLVKEWDAEESKEDKSQSCKDACLEAAKTPQPGIMPARVAELTACLNCYNFYGRYGTDSQVRECKRGHNCNRNAEEDRREIKAIEAKNDANSLEQCITDCINLSKSASSSCPYPFNSVVGIRDNLFTITESIRKSSVLGYLEKLTILIEVCNEADIVESEPGCEWSKRLLRDAKKEARNIQSRAIQRMIDNGVAPEPYYLNPVCVDQP